MLFVETNFTGVYMITFSVNKDNRGFFARNFCKQEFADHGLENEFVQCNISFNRKKGTIRGLHYQIKPFEEIKIVFCQSGKIYDVIVDLRENSPSYTKWIAIELAAEKHQALYIPKGFAHGFQTLTDNTEIFYLMGTYYQPTAARGIRFDDPKLNIPWPYNKIIISKRDRKFPNLQT